MAKVEEPSETFKLPIASETEVPHNAQGNAEKNETEERSGIIAKKASNTSITLPYTEPDWSGPPPLLYSFEIIKNGTPVSTLKIEASLTVFGRLDICDVIFEHPSVSRFHAVIQFCKGDEFRQRGFYLYDLGSTHGTYLNKDRIKPKIYYKLKVGYILKFGGSTRLHIFQGPEEEDHVEEKNILPSKEENEICDWGIGEDAEEDDDDLSENPFALSTPNEELYLEDPKKTLRGWFEREGYELEYHVEEKGFKTFMCRIQLPVDNPTGDYLPIEVSVSGKKKEAVVACALEACRTLDRLGLLRQSHQESRQRKKKKWEEDDYYDSDEDTFLDRTGAIEKKRELRKKMEKKSEVETFQTIEAKLQTVTEEINEISRKLSVSAGNVPLVSNSEEDSLEIYMSSLSNSKSSSDKVERSKLKFRLSEAEKEKARLEKLLEIARPAKLPPVTKYPGMIGKKIKSKLQIPVSKSADSSKHTKKLNQEENIEENDSDSDNSVEQGNNKNGEKEIDSGTKFSTTEPEKDMNKNSNHFKNLESDSKSYGLIIPKQENKYACNIASALHENKSENEMDTLSSAPSKRSIGPEKPVESVSVDDEPSVTLKSREVTGSVGNKRLKKKDDSERSKGLSDVYMSDTANYTTWVPPKNQSGDGMTHLNAKYGY